MDFLKEFFEAIVFGVIALLSWIVRKLWSDVEKVEDNHYVLMSQLPENYVSKIEFIATTQRIDQTLIDQYARLESKLDRIVDKLDNKADKH